MTAKEIYKATKKFPTRLLLLNVAMAVGSILLFILVGGIGLATKSAGMVFGGLFLSLIVYKIGGNIINHYIGYMFKYGAVHAIMKGVVEGRISDTYFSDSVEYVKNGFLKSNIYMVVDKLVNAAVRGVTRLANFILGFLPENIRNMMNIFINIYLNYIDECCLAYSMIHVDENVAKSSCDGIVLYYQNAKSLLKPAFKTSLRVIITKGIIFLIGFLFLFWVPLAVIWWMLALAIVDPYLNHRILCETMVAYLDVALKDTVRTDIYEKLHKCRPFAKLQEKENDPNWDIAPGNPSYAAAAVNTEVIRQSVPIPEPEVKIPEPEVPAMSQEQIMWQQAWQRMSPQQKQMYNGMSPTDQNNWKKQILKALFNYDM